MNKRNDDSYSACAWCGTAAEDSTLSYTPHGLCCPRCVRTAQAEQMRAADMKGRAPDSQRTELHQLVERLREACQVTTPPIDAAYPSDCVRAAGNVELSVAALDVAELVYCASSEAKTRDDLEFMAAKTIEDLVWLVRWQTKELAHAGRQIVKAREERDAADARFYLPTSKGGEA